MSICRATNKRRWSLQASAIAKAAWMQARGRDLGHRPLNVYRCAMCGDWHIGHRPIVFAVQTPPPPAPAAERCQLACKKEARETVWTPTGNLRVCPRHARRLRAAYQQPVVA